MTEYIDRKEVIEAIKSLPNCYNGFSDTYDKACIIGILEELPADHVQTNADRIRAMTDEELDRFLCGVQWDVANYCGGVTQKQEYPVPEQRGAWLEWLKKESE